MSTESNLTPLEILEVLPHSEEQGAEGRLPKEAEMKGTTEDGLPLVPPMVQQQAVVPSPVEGEVAMLIPQAVGQVEAGEVWPLLCASPLLKPVVEELAVLIPPALRVCATAESVLVVPPLVLLQPVVPWEVAVLISEAAVQVETREVRPPVQASRMDEHVAHRDMEVLLPKAVKRRATAEGLLVEPQ